ncbi:hypothetical protein MOK15_05255 [Sphingobium sp. BYY-5]|uniref:WD40/YVTN/BNR-like repeat-containing protein n=1 Tax=Sphingobium sp. BYY-5 TaxID=2926400 RepID=UPI001FA7D959|nr:hypothetical protein [Sphingobium sp. BYY-5]MCI4589498.1 hypothetical protein [Sphingobium sp. BYY-5]
MKWAITLLGILAVAGAAPYSAKAEKAEAPAPYLWRNVTVGAGGFAPNIIFSTAERDLAYLRTDMGGAYRWEAKEARWVPLQDSMAEGSYMGIESLAADPSDPNIVYLAAGMYRGGAAAILRSDDRGTTWRVTPVSFAMGGNEDGRGMGERLAIDPGNTRTLFFGSRHDGLWRSDDGAATWRKVDSFPLPGLGLPGRRQPTHGGISFVVIDPGTGAIFAGSADPGDRHLFRSLDHGATWQQVEGGPPPTLLPVKAAIDRRGMLYIAYCNGIGPNGITAGAVWRFDTKRSRWTDITPDKAQVGGFMGLSLDPSAPGTLAVSSVDRWKPGDTIWRTQDDGAHWTDIHDMSRHDTHASPFLQMDGDSADFGHWTAGVAIDPFNPGRAAYVTGATVYMTTDFADPKAMLWKPWVKGIEQTAIITLVSPTGGAALISGFGDIAGFVHDDLTVSPAHGFSNPYLSNTNNIDYAGRHPDILVRSGSLHANRPRDATLGWSQDGGRSWQPLRVPPMAAKPGAEEQRQDLEGNAPIVTSADGATFIVATPIVMLTRDRGSTWLVPKGLTWNVQPVADKVDPRRFYAVDVDRHRLLASKDGGLSFAPVKGRGLPADLEGARMMGREQPASLVASPFAAGDLWLRVGTDLYHSINGGASFDRVNGTLPLRLFALGKPAPDSGIATIFATGILDGTNGIWRSTDEGQSWRRINDDAHQWGLRFRVIAGDPRIFGRVYLGTDGRGVLYGDPGR